jgi:hypothetical protein
LPSNTRIERKIEERIAVKRRRRGRPKQLLYGLKDERILEIVRGSTNRTLGKTPFGRAYGPVVRQYY